MAVIDFHFDFSSPYAYFASHRVDDVAARVGRLCRWRPMLLGPAFQATGNANLISQPLKGDYVRRDWERLARLMAVPYRMPDPFPVGTVAAARIFWWADDEDSARAKLFARAMFDAYFGQGRDISQKDVVVGVAADCGFDPQASRAAIDDPRWKDRLRAETEGAVAAGVFGAPFFVVDGEGFWGADRLPMVEEWCRRGGW